MRKAGLKNNIPEPTGDSVSHLHTPGTMVVEMITFDVPEVRISEVIKMYAVVNPLFSQIALNDSCQQHGGCVKRKDKAQGRSNHKERKKVF
jgi:hypothetical protein